MPKLHLITGGRAYWGWQTMRVATSIERVSGEFELRVSDEWPSSDFTQAIYPQDECEVLIDTDRVISGYVDAVSLSISDTDHSVSIRGRDKAADLVDCSAIRRAGQWRGLKIEQIAADLAAPFGVTVTAEVDTGKALSSFALQEGETAFEAISRAAAMRALLVVSNGRGGMVITRAGVARVTTSIVQGENMLSGSGSLDMRDRYSDYYAKGQAPGGDFFNGKAASQISAKTADPGVKRYRPMVLTADSPDIAASLTQRVRWEANVRAARSTDVTVRVQGWSHADGLWRVNHIVHVRAPGLRLDDDLLIKGVTYSLDEKGTIAELQLTRADAYTLLPIKAIDPTASAAGFWSTPKAETGGR